MKRFKLRHKLYKVSTADMTDLDEQAYEDKWLLKTERLEAKRWRRFRQQLTV